MTRRKKSKNKTFVEKVMNKLNKDLLKEEEDIFWTNFTFPTDLDKIQPDSINGNLTIKFPE